MKNIISIFVILALLTGCGKSIAPSSSETLAAPNMKLPMTVLQLQMTCEDIASIILVSMSNRLRNEDVFKTRSYARSLADTLDTRFPDLALDTRLQARRLYMQTVSDQYVADQSVISQQVETFRTYGEEKFKDGSVNMCKRALANIPDGAPLPTIKLTSK